MMISSVGRIPNNSQARELEIQDKKEELVWTTSSIHCRMSLEDKVAKIENLSRSLLSSGTSLKTHGISKTLRTWDIRCIKGLADQIKKKREKMELYIKTSWIPNFILKGMYSETLKKLGNHETRLKRIYTDMQTSIDREGKNKFEMKNEVAYLDNTHTQEKAKLINSQKAVISQQKSIQKVQSDRLKAIQAKEKSKLQEQHKYEEQRLESLQGLNQANMQAVQIEELRNTPSHLKSRMRKHQEFVMSRLLIDHNFQSNKLFVRQLSELRSLESKHQEAQVQMKKEHRGEITVKVNEHVSVLKQLEETQKAQKASLKADHEQEKAKTQVIRKNAPDVVVYAGQQQVNPNKTLSAEFNTSYF